MIGRLASVLFVFASLRGIRDVSAELPAFVTPEIIDMVHDDKVRCMGEFGTTQEMIDEVNNGKILNDRKLTCYMNCLFEAFGMIDEDTGNLEYEMLVGFLPDDVQDQGREVLIPCSEQPGADICEKVYNIAICVQSKAPSMWFML